MTRRRYTRAEKATAVMAAEATSAAAAAEATGIPENTIRYWLDHPDFVELRSKTAEERAEQFRVVSQLALARLVRLIPSMKAHDLIVLAGVSVDKDQLLSGKATNRTEQVSITDGLDDHEKAALKRTVLDELARRSDERAAETAVGDPAETGADPA